MQKRKFSLNLFKIETIKNAFKVYSQVAKGKITINQADNIVEVTFFADDENIMKEFSNYLIGLSATKV